MRRWLALTLILSLVPVTAVLAQQQWQPEVKFVRFAVATAGGDWFRAGAKYTTFVPEAIPGLAASTLMGGGVVNVSKVGKGEAQIGFALTPYPEEGYHGKGSFKEPIKNVRLAASRLGRSITVALIVLKDSPIKTIHDLKGKRIVTGDRGWGTTVLAEAIMTGAGMPPDKFRAEGGTISYVSITDRAKALQDRNIDAFWIPAQVNYPDVMVIQQSLGLRVVPLPKDVIEATIASVPGAVRGEVLKGLYGVLEENMESPAFLQQLIVDAALSEELVYRLTKLWWERIDEIMEVAPTFQGSDVKLAMEGAAIPFHPGALRYYKEVGVAR